MPVQLISTFEFVRNPRPYADDIWKLLQVADAEFVPSLSERVSTTQRAGLEKRTHNGLQNYYEHCLNQPTIIVRDVDDVRGFLSFRHAYEIAELKDYAPANYVSTIIVHPGHRRKGYARGMYKKLLTDIPADLYLPFVTTRTWETNKSHLKLLDELGFSLLMRLENDRGEGIDTVYYGIVVDEFDRADS